MITKFDNFLNEGITEVIYHRTYLSPLIRILKSGKILLSSSLHSPANSYDKRNFYLSFSRTKNTRLGYLSNAPVIIELDGKMLGTKYKGGPVDFNWVYLNKKTNPNTREESDEYEERIYSNKPYLENLNKYIKYIDIIVENIETISQIKATKTPLLDKIRVFNNKKDFSYGKNWKSIFEYEDTTEDTKEFDFDTKYLNFDLLKDIIIVLLIGDKKIKDKEYVKNFFLKYINKFIDKSDKLKEIDDNRINSIIYDLPRKIEWINPNDRNDEFIVRLINNIQMLSTSSRKNEISYEVLELLSDEMIKYKVTTIGDLIRVKRGEKKIDVGNTIDSIRNWFKEKDNMYGGTGKTIKEEQIKDYSDIYGFVYQQGDRYILVDNNKENHFLRWTKLETKIKNKIHEQGFDATTKNIINSIFHFYNKDKAKELIFAITEDIDYKFVDLRNKMIYKEITEKDYLGDDIGGRSCWQYVDKDNWYRLLYYELGENEVNKKSMITRIIKLLEDENVKLRFIWSVTEKLLGKEKTDKFFEENNLIPREGDRGESGKRYLLRINDKKKQ
jgi:hypothetical protein